jgi:NitT/TauT family transport system ATP-binding protein
MRIEVRDLSIRFATGVQAVTGANLTVASGEFVAIVGPSGCGKSTLLNAIAGLLTPDEAEVMGDILANGVDVRKCTPRDLNVGYVFQRDNLLPWRTIQENVETGLQIRGVDIRARRRRSADLMEMASLTGFEHYYPHQVSGGMRQRASLIRTLAYEPQLILRDEPFGALDAHTRMILQAELLRIWERTQKTILFVTHDLSEAIILAQRIALFSKRPGSVRREYEIDLPHPRDPFELRGSTRFGELETTIWRTLRDDFRVKVAA